MKRLAYLVGLAILPITLAACTAYTSTKTNTNTAAVIDLTNSATNTAAVLNQPRQTAGSGSAGNANSNTNAALNTNATTNTNAVANTNTNAATVITVTASGFSPSTVTVKAGTVVTWTNSSGGDIRVSSDPHPTHTDLPGLDSSTLANGDSYSFTFTKVGTWGYHNHLDPTTRGSVIVQ